MFLLLCFLSIFCYLLFEDYKRRFPRKISPTGEYYYATLTQHSDNMPKDSGYPVTLCMILPDTVKTLTELSIVKRRATVLTSEKRPDENYYGWVAFFFKTLEAREVFLDLVLDWKNCPTGDPDYRDLVESSYFPTREEVLSYFAKE